MTSEYEDGGPKSAGAGIAIGTATTFHPGVAPIFSHYFKPSIRKGRNNMTTENTTETTETNPDLETGDDTTTPASEQTNDTTSTEQETETKPDKAGADAAKYRRQLRTTETERDALRARIDRYERAEVEGLAADMVDPADLWTVGTTLDDLRGEDGTIDPEKVLATVTGLIEQRPHWGTRTGPKPDLSQGARGGAPGGAGWSDVLKRK